MSKRKFEKKPLYRKVNTRARGVTHRIGPDFRHQRNTKAERAEETAGVSRGAMKQGVKRGLDYTPLVRFLHSRVGQPFAEVHSEAVARLDREEPIFWFVAEAQDDGNAIVRLGESSYWSGMYVDEAGLLQLVKPDIDPETLWPSCACCTHTFNGVVFPNTFDQNRATSLLEAMS